MNHARVPEIFPHKRRWFATRDEAKMDDVPLRVKTQQILVATSLVVQEAAQRTQKLARPRQARGRIRIQLAQFSEPADQVQIAQAAGRFFQVRRQMIKGVLKLSVPGTRQVAQMAAQGSRLPL